MRRPVRVRLAIPAVLALTALGACPHDDDDDASTGASATEGGDDCEIAEQDECESHPACMWGVDVEFCVIDCSQLADAQTCEQATFCEWIDAACEHHAT